MRPLLACLVLVLVLLVHQGNGDASFVDLFQTVGVVTTSTAQPGGSWNFFSGGDIVGSERDVSIQILSGPSNSFASAGVGTRGVLSVHTDVEVNANFLIQYDGPDESMSLGDIMVDLTANGNTNTFHLVTEYSGQAFLSIVAYIENQDTACTAEVPLDANDGDLHIPFNVFTAKGGGLCDLSSVSSLELYGELGSNSDLYVTDFGVVWTDRPVPESIDSFSAESSRLSCNGGYTVSEVTSGIDVLGGERDLILSLTHGDSANMQVMSDIWDIHTGDDIVGEAVCQYDGPDESTDLSPRGLGSVDLTQSYGSGFLVEMTCTQVTVVIVRASDVHGAAVSCAGAVLASGSPTQTTIPFSSCQPGNLDFTQVGSIELGVQLQENSHIRVSNFGLSRLPTSPSPSPSRSRGGPSPTRTPTISRTPSRTSPPTNSPHVTPTPRPSRSAPDSTHPVVIDNFTAATAEGNMYLSSSAPPAVSTGSITLSGDVLGVERDVEITIEQGDALTQVVFGEQENFYIRMPPGASGTATLQYDGPDLSNTISTRGLGGVDFTFGGAAYLGFEAESSIGSQLTLDIYDMDGGLATYNDELRSGGGYYYVPFGAFRGEVDWTNVGAVQLTISLKSSLEMNISNISTVCLG